LYLPAQLRQLLGAENKITAILQAGFAGQDKRLNHENAAIYA